MEPMTLGSPTGSPSTTGGVNSYLPPFLMGESNISSTSRNNTLSPTKGRTVSFVQSPVNMPQSPEFNRSNLTQKSFLGYQKSPTHSYGTQSNVTKSISGPPTQSLFDLMHSEKISMQQSTPTRNSIINNQIQSPTYMNSPSINQSHLYNQSFKDTSLNQSNFNSSKILSPLERSDFRSQSMLNTTNCGIINQSDYWITVFGFPLSATSLIISHFAQCGNIVDKHFPTVNGNWIHLKFSSRLECDKALNYNEKILCDNLMIGVTRCKDPAIIDDENIENETTINRVRPLAHAGYKSVQHPVDVLASNGAPKRSTGLVNKAMDLFFGW